MSTDSRRQMLFWGLALVVFIFLFWLLSGVLLPFIAGMAVAYFLDPVADRLERLGLSRGLAALTLTIAFIAVLTLLLFMIVPLVYGQLIALLQSLPDYIATIRERILPMVQDLLTRLDVQSSGNLRAAAADSVNKAISMLGSVVTNLLGGGLAIVNLLSLLVITPVVAFYLLRDWDRMMAHVDSWLPRHHAETIREQAREIDMVMAGFVRGQSLVCLTMGTYYATGLTLVGLEFGLAIGIVTGLITFIPYVGAFLGFLLSAGVAIVQFWPEYLPIAMVMLVFFGGQVLESYFLVPRLVGDRVGLHPVWVIFGLLAGGALFGFVGVLIALPVFAAVGVMARFFLGRYLASSLYHGGGPPAAP